MKKNIWLIIGFIIYILLLVVDRFVYKLPNYVYIITCLIVIILIIVGLINDKKDINKKS
ncbi:MAG: hypothetical protein PUC23_04440 [bacterium]|nr:hypothetical protein [bacterium]